MSKIEVEELVVDRHVKMSSALGRIDVHASDNTLGIWISPKDSKAPCGQFGVFIDHGRVCLGLYPDYPTKNVPFAISTAGLQVVKRDGTVIVMPLEKLAELVESVMKQ